MGASLSQGLCPLGLSQELFCLRDVREKREEPAEQGRAVPLWPVQDTLPGQVGRKCSGALSPVVAFTGTCWKSQALPFAESRGDTRTSARPLCARRQAAGLACLSSERPLAPALQISSSCRLTLVFSLWNGLCN